MVVLTACEGSGMESAVDNADSSLDSFSVAELAGDGINNRHSADGQGGRGRGFPDVALLAGGFASSQLLDDQDVSRFSLT